MAQKHGREEGKSPAPENPSQEREFLLPNACADEELSMPSDNPHVVRQLTLSQTSF